MTTEIKMPRLSETMVDGRILSWNKKAGDRVNKGDILAEVETDKANMEIEAVDSGTVSDILIGEGQIAKVGETIAVLNGKAKAKPEPPEITKAPAKPTEQEPTPKAKIHKPEELPEKPTEEKIKEQPKEEKVESAQFQYKTEKEAVGEEKEFEKVEEVEKKEEKPAEKEILKASPLARKLAKENNIDLYQILGTGPGDRIIEEDVQKYLNQKQQPEDVRKEVSPEKHKEEKPEVKTQTISRMRQTIAKRMVESKQNIPHFYVTYEVNADKLVRFHEAAQEEIGHHLTLNDIFIKVTANILKHNPMFNASFKGDYIEIHDRVNIGIAFAVENGLLVPVIPDCDKKSLQEIASDTSGIKSRVKTNKLTPEDMMDGTFSISNMGMYGVKEFTAIINPPESAGLAIGAIMKAPVVKDDQIVISNIVSLTLSADHRVVNGAEAATFLKSIKDVLEDPEQIE